MITTFIKYVDWSREVQYGQQTLAKSKDLDSYTYIDLSEKDLKRIEQATTDQVQDILKEFY